MCGKKLLHELIALSDIFMREASADFVSASMFECFEILQSWFAIHTAFLCVSSGVRRPWAQILRLEHGYRVICSGWLCVVRAVALGGTNVGAES